MQDVGGMLVYADFQTKNHHWILKGCGIAAARMSMRRLSDGSRSLECAKRDRGERFMK